MKLFVWDFHGVLEKGNDDAVKVISNLALKQLGYSKRFSTNDCGELSGLKWFEYFKYLLPEESHESHLKLQERCFYISETKSDIILDYIKPNDYAHQVLSKIMKQHKQILISNTASSHLKIFLNSVEMEKYFPKGFSFGIGAHTNNKTKIRCLEKFLENKEFENIIIIGDSKSDMNLKYVAGGISYLYAHPEKPFRACDADYKINDLREILKEI